MKTLNLYSWEDFEEVVKQNNITTDNLKKNKYKVGAVTPIIYRGQADAEWHLKSNLERKVNRVVTVDSYFNIMLKIWNGSNIAYKHKWPDLQREIENLDVDGLYLFPTERANSEQIIAFMTHLRHHGFPSPLLDWTSNPLIAAFFSFEDIPDIAERVAIYTFRNYTGYTPDMSEMSKPTLIEIGPDIPGISRHANQKSHYTICVQQDNRSSFKKARFANPEEDLNKRGFYVDGQGIDVDVSHVQNVAQKYTIPVSERHKVLRKLQAMKIDRCFLFEETEDNQLSDFWNIILANEEI